MYVNVFIYHHKSCTIRRTVPVRETVNKMEKYKIKMVIVCKQTAVCVVRISNI